MRNQAQGQEPGEVAFKWKGWKWTLTMFALSVGHAVLWSVVYNTVYIIFLHLGLIKKN
jgi:hypothetical protein